MKRKSIKKIVFFCYVIILLALAYLATVAYRGRTLYRYIKEKRPILTAGVIEPEPVLGFAPGSNSVGLLMFKSPPHVNCVYDRDRCRVSSLKPENKKATTFLFLGCSFTHGDACESDNTYPHLVAEHFDAQSRNRGFCAYGLSQMVLIAQQVIPSIKPTYVFAQYSPWIVARPMSHFAPSHFIRRPQPFYTLKDGQAQLHAPPYTSFQAHIPVVHYREAADSLKSKISFLFSVALPLYMNEDIRYLAYKTRHMLGLIPSPATDRQSVITAGYEKIAHICEANNAHLVVPIIGNLENKPEEQDLETLRTIQGINLVDCWSPLLKELPDADKSTFMSRYAHFRGSPPELVDTHPNKEAHTIIANSIISQITKNN